MESCLRCLATCMATIDVLSIEDELTFHYLNRVDALKIDHSNLDKFSCTQHYLVQSCVELLMVAICIDKSTTTNFEVFNVEQNKTWIWQDKEFRWPSLVFGHRKIVCPYWVNIVRDWNPLHKNTQPNMGNKNTCIEDVNIVITSNIISVCFSATNNKNKKYVFLPPLFIIYLCLCSFIYFFLLSSFVPIHLYSYSYINATFVLFNSNQFSQTRHFSQDRAYCKWWMACIEVNTQAGTSTQLQ